MPEITSSKYLVQAGWDDVPHLDEQTKAELLAATPPHLRDARTKGLPALGAGAIWPVPLEDLLVDPFPIPNYWPRCYALDVGWNKTAALWGAWDRQTDTLYLYTEHYRGQAEPSIHATAIKARGAWIPGCIDPAARGRNQKDGDDLLAVYQDLGLKLTLADNRLHGDEGGIYRVWEMASTGRLKVFRTLMNWQAEFRLYRRDENGKIVKAFDHLMDCTRYIVQSYRGIAVVVPVAREFISPGGGDPTVGY